MFYDVYCQLCAEKGLTPSGAAAQIGFNRASVTVWKNSGKPPKMDLLLKIADYFGVTVDFLLGNEPKETPPPVSYGGLSEIYFSLAKEAQDSEIDPDDFRAVLKFYTDAKNKRKQ